MVEVAEVAEAGDGGGAVVGAVDDVVGLAFEGGPVAAAGELALLAAGVDGFPDAPGDSLFSNSISF